MEGYEVGSPKSEVGRLVLIQNLKPATEPPPCGVSSGGLGTVNVTWDPVLEQTHVTATIPEPVSICLVGLGALLLRRRS